MIDAHAHLYDEKLIIKSEQLLKEAKDAGVVGFVVPSTDYESMCQARLFCQKHESCRLIVGYYPCDVKKLEDNEELHRYLNFIETHKNEIIGIGEIGLDFYWEKTIEERKTQKKWFIYQIDLANKYNIPVCIHTRDAIQETYNILKEHPVNRGFYLHAFNASLEMTKLFIKLNAYFSIGGVVTYKNANLLRETIKILPLDRIFIETDCPYLPPVPFRGKINEPKYIKNTLSEISKTLGIDENKMDKITMENIKNFFHVEKWAK